MQTIERTPGGTTRKIYRRANQTKIPLRNGQGRKDYGTERCCNSFLKNTLTSIVPGFLIKDWGGESHNLLTWDNYEFLRDSYLRYAELLDVKAEHYPGRTVGESIHQLFYDMRTILGDNIDVNLEYREDRLYFTLWRYHKWGNCKLYYFPVKFVETLNPTFRRIAITFIHNLMWGNGFDTIADQDDVGYVLEWLFEMEYADNDGKELKEHRKIIESYREGKIYRLLKRVDRKSYYKNLPKALERYKPQNDKEKKLVELMKKGLVFLNPEKPIMRYAYDPYYEEEPEYPPMGLEQQIRVVYDLDDFVSNGLVEQYNCNHQETYDIQPITTLMISPETDSLFTIEDDYPERFYMWANEFINETS